jgi:hypothetical protein
MQLLLATALAGARPPYDYVDGPFLLPMYAPFVVLRDNLTLAKNIYLKNLRLR